MKYTLLNIVFLFSTQFCFGQDTANDWLVDSLPSGFSSREMIKEHKIDSIIVTMDFEEEKITRQFAFDSFGKTNSIVYFIGKEIKIGESLFRYNKAGELIEKRDKLDLGDIEMDIKKNCFVNDLGQVTKCIIVDKNKDTVEINATYNTNEIIYEGKLNGGKRTITSHKYDIKNKLIEETSISFEKTDSQGTIYFHRLFTYDPHGNKTLEIGHSLSKIDSIIYTYDNYNRLTSIHRRLYTETYSYNESGLISKRMINYTKFGENTTYTEYYRYAFRK